MYVKNDELTALQDKTESLAKENVKLEDKVKEKTNNEKLKMHNRVYHSHNKGTQSKENGVFEEFNCFYFDEKIISGDKLEDHTTDCQSVFDSPINLPSMYLEQWPCDICEAKFNDMLDLERHKTSYHQQDMRDAYNPCYEGLRNHIRSLTVKCCPPKNLRQILL